MTEAMVTLLRRISLAALISAAAILPAAAAAQGPPAQIRFRYENPQLQPAKYSLLVIEDGSGHYHSEIGAAPPESKEDLPARPQDREIHISKATRERIFTAARDSKYFAMACDGGGKHVAFQGTKTLEYKGDEGQGSCTYNWSKEKQIESLTSIFEGIALTLEEGAKLQMEYEHSRLSLDSELELLDTLAQQGRALELGNIAPSLRTIANDQAVLKRAQRRARELLAMAQAE